MKRCAVLLAVVITLGILMMSCRSTSCPAYGDYRQYQIETVY